MKEIRGGTATYTPIEAENYLIQFAKFWFLNNEYDENKDYNDDNYVQMLYECYTSQSDLDLDLLLIDLSEKLTGIEFTEFNDESDRWVERYVEILKNYTNWAFMEKTYSNIDFEFYRKYHEDRYKKDKDEIKA